MFLHQNKQLLLVHDKRCFVSHCPAAFQFEIPMTTFVEFHMVTGRSLTWAGRTKAAFRRPMLIHTCHAVPMPCCAVALRSCFQNSMDGARQGRNMELVSHV